VGRMFCFQACGASGCSAGRPAAESACLSVTRDAARFCVPATAWGAQQASQLLLPAGAPTACKPLAGPPALRRAPARYAATPRHRPPHTRQLLAPPRNWAASAAVTRLRRFQKHKSTPNAPWSKKAGAQDAVSLDDDWLRDGGATKRWRGEATKVRACTAGPLQRH
jgi:hypothetical protein